MKVYGRAQPVQDFLEQKVIPRLSVRQVYPTAKWTKEDFGGLWRGICPFHPGADNPRAFVVRTSDLSFHCNTHCGPGSVLAAINGGREPKGAEYYEVARKLAELAGVEASFPTWEETPEQKERREAGRRKENLLEAVYNVALEAIQGDTSRAGWARTYLDDRGLPVDPEDNRLGLYESPEALRSGLVRVGYTAERLREEGLDLRDLGLLNSGWNGSLLIPWRDPRGGLKTLVARLTRAPIDKDEGKYQYLRGGSPDTPVFLDEGLRLGGRDNLLLVEGFLDAYHLVLEGIPAAGFGGRGTKLTASMLEKLDRLGIRRVTLLLDNDKQAEGKPSTGLEDTITVLQTAAKVAKSGKTPEVYVLDPRFLSPHKDADEYLEQKGGEKLRALLPAAVPGNVYLGASYLEKVSPTSPEADRREALEKVAAHLAGLEGRWRKADEEDLLRLLEQRAGYTREALGPLLEEKRALLRREEGLQALRSLEEAWREGPSSGEVRKRINALLRVAGDEGKRAPEPAETFSVDRLLQEARDAQDGRSTGWEALNKVGISFRPEELSLVGARTGHCKTVFLVGLLHHWLKNSDPDELLLFYSYEEPERRIGEKLVTLLAYEEAMVSVRDRPLRWQVEDALRIYPNLEGASFRPALENALQKLRDWEDRFAVLYRPSFTADALAAEVEAFAQQKGRRVGAVLVDYLQHIPPPAWGRSPSRRDVEVSAVGRVLEELAVRLGAPVIAGAQMNREPVTGTKLPPGAYEDEKVRREIRKRRPELHHLREGGSEQEADMVLGLLSYGADYRDEEETPPPPVTRLEVGVLKSRYSTPGSWASLAFEGARGLIRDPREGDHL